jgi:DNA-binding winged helix-turn-helix (wHTH) protein/tetratricopeptide (TPR) repeat protein
MTSASDGLETKSLALGPLRIDLRNGTIVGPDGPSGLSPRAESLLLLLCRHANTPVSRDEMHKTVWAGRIVEDTAITSAIWQIRKVLGDDDKSLLQTRAKRGYALMVPERAWSEGRASGPTNLAAPHLNCAPQRNHIDSAASTPTFSETSANTAPLPVTAHSRRRMPSRILVAFALGALALSVAIAYRVMAPPTRMPLSPDAGMTVSIEAPESLVWLRPALLRVAAEETHRRGSGLILFEKLQRHNPFSGPHLQVAVRASDTSNIVADLSLTQSGLRVERKFFGKPAGLPVALHALLESVLSPGRSASPPAAGAYIDGLVAHLQYDTQGAIERYRHAIARAPHMKDARIALGGALHEQGLSREALVIMAAIADDDSLSPNQRCRLDELLLSVAPERIREPPCAPVKQLRLLRDYDARQALRQLTTTSAQKKSASAWLADASATIDAYLMLGEWAQAEAAISRAVETATDAGWEYARIALASKRGLVALYRKQVETAAASRWRTAAEFEAIGATRDALRHRISALRIMPIVPGPDIARRRGILSATVGAARRLGIVQIEVDALQLLLRVDRDDPELWRSHMRRLETLIDAGFTPKAQILQRQIMLDEIRAQRRFGDALAGLQRMRTTATSAQDRMFVLLLEAEAHFARDELDAAVAAVAAMEKENFKIGDTGNSCLFSWLFAEAGQPVRARALLAECRAEPFDRASQAQRGDYGLLAEARLYRLAGEPEQVWQLLQGRIAALLATPELIRPEADALSMLTRATVGMPGADASTWQRALAKTASVARLDGAGPGVRLGVHLLRWKMCAHTGDSDCGPVLPVWAAEDRLEARLADEAAAGDRFATNVR